MFIDTGSEVIELAGCLENSCVLRRPVDLAPFNGTLVIRVDVEEFRTPVHFFNGISAESDLAEFNEMDEEEAETTEERQTIFPFSNLFKRKKSST